MKLGLLFLPFLALLIGAVGTAFGSALSEAKWITQVAWAVAAGVVALWVALDWDNFKSFFKRKGAKYGASSGLVVLLGMLVIVGLATVAARPRFNKSIDLTREGLNTLSEQSIKLVDQIKKDGKDVKVTAFFTDEAGHAQFRDLMALYQARGANFSIEYIDPQQNPVRAKAERIDEQAGGNTAIFRLGSQEKRITTMNEEKVTNALVNILKEKSKKIYFTKGHGEGAVKGQEATGFNKIVEELEGNKNAVEELSLLETAKVPEDANMVIIAGPRYDLKEEEVRILEDYLKRGGSVLAMINAMTPVPVLGHMLEQFGVKLANDLLILPPNDIRAQMLGQNNAIITGFDDMSPVTKDFATQSAVALALRNTRSVEKIEDNPNKLKVDLVAKTAKMIIKVRDVHSAEDLENLTEDRWEMGEFPVIAVASGKTPAQSVASNDKAAKDVKADAGGDADPAQAKETRLVVVGSTEFANNSGAQEPAHRDMFLNMTSYLLQDDDFISIRPKDPTKSALDVTSSESQIGLLLLAFIYPFLFLGTGTVVWLRRRRA